MTEGAVTAEVYLASGQVSCLFLPPRIKGCLIGKIRTDRDHTSSTMQCKLTCVIDMHLMLTPIRIQGPLRLLHRQNIPLFPIIDIIISIVPRERTLCQNPHPPGALRRSYSGRQRNSNSRSGGSKIYPERSQAGSNSFDSFGREGRSSGGDLSG